MKNLAKLLICCSCLNSSAFSYGMQESPYQEIFSPETSEAWEKYKSKSKRRTIPTERLTVDSNQTWFDLQACSKNDKIAKYLIDNTLLTSGSDERKSCWTRCCNIWKRANDLLATLAVGLERISCDDERRKYRQAASLAVVNRIKEIHVDLFKKYDTKYIDSRHRSTGNFQENHDKDESATRRLYDSIDKIIGVPNVSGVANCPELYYFMMATLDDMKIGEALYWQREADLLLFDVQASLLLEMDPQAADAIREALALRNESLSPPTEHGSQFDKILNNSGLLRQANAILEERISNCKPPVSKAMAIVNKCKNLARIDGITADEKNTMMKSSVDAFSDMFAMKHLGQFLLTTTEPQTSLSMIKNLKNDFASLREIMIAYVNFHSANVESVSKALMRFEEMINGMRMTELVNIVNCIPHETMAQLMHVTPDNFARLKSAKDDDLLIMLDYVPAIMQWLKDLNSAYEFIKPDWGVYKHYIISKESMERLTALTPEILRLLQEMPAYMRELFMRTPIEFAEIVDCEIDTTYRIIEPLSKRANLICQKDGDIESYTKEWVNYILEVLKNFTKTEITHGAQLALQSASEIVMHNRLSGAFDGSYTTESVLDCLFNLINRSIQKTAIVDIMNEMLGASDVQTARTKIVSEHFRIFKEKFGQDVAFELINHRSLNTQNKNLYDQYVKELNETTKTYLLNNAAKMIEISQRLYGDISHAVQLISMISKVDDPYEVYASLNNDIEPLLEESILKDYIRGIRRIQIKDTVLSL